MGKALQGYCEIYLTKLNLDRNFANNLLIN